MKKLAVLISDGGTGSNLQAIIDAIENKTLRASVAVVVSDTPDAFGRERAKKHQISSLVISKQDDIAELLTDTYPVDYIVLAGWKMIVTEEMLDIFKNRILNLHPGLIPDSVDGTVICPDGTRGLWNRGKFTNKALQNFIDQKATYAGSSVHFLTHVFDFGPVRERCFVEIARDDTAETLYDRLKKEEHRIIVASLKTLCLQDGKHDLGI